MAIRNDCLLPLTSGGTEDRFDIGGAPGAPCEDGPTLLALAKLASVSLPLPDFPPDLSLSFLLLPEALLPEIGKIKKDEFICC